MPGSLSRTAFVGLALVFSATTQTTAQDARGQIMASIEASRSEYGGIARQIWSHPELGYQEEQSSSLLQSHLRDAGFAIEAGVAEIPTAFVASYGQGEPVIGILAEFDALPGMSQAAVPERQPRVPDGAGHACGHHLFGTGSMAAAVAVKEWLKTSGKAGTIRLYGTPAEEGGSGKVYMVRAGLFDDVHAAFHWHPRDRNNASPKTSVANKSAKFRFYGISTHAAAAPERGRSALDGVEAMNFMVNLMREHIPPVSRVHYVITRGGAAPNIVPDFAEVYYYVRHPEAKILNEIWPRVVSAAEGAAQGTGTRVEHEVIHGNHSLLPNEVMSRLVDKNLRLVGGMKYTPEEMAFARAIHATLGATERGLGSEEEIMPYQLWHGKGSTDVGDVSWTVPTAGLVTATWVPGTAAHSWQATAAGGTSIGEKGMLMAAKTLAMSAVDLFEDPPLLEKAREEFEDKRGPDFHYRPLLGDRKPPLDYRK